MTRKRLFFLGLCGLMAMGAGCQPQSAPPQIVKLPAGPAPDAAKQALVMKTYEVPGGYGQQVKSVLSSAFYGVKDHVGARAVVGPDGQLVVVGPAGLHEGVQALLATMKDKPAATPPPTFGMRTWLVLGSPTGGEGHRRGALKSAGAALDALEKAQGAMDFWLLERLDVQVLGDDRAEVRGRHAQAGVRASVWNERLLMDVQLKAGRSEITTRLSARPGQQVVLGEAGANLRDFDGHPLPEGHEGPVTLFYIVQADIQDAG